MLSNGEFVVTALATARYLPLLEAMNANRFADGGLATATATAGTPTPAAAGAIAASLAIDPAVFAALGAATAAVQATLEALATSITTVENPALAAMGAAAVLLASHDRRAGQRHGRAVDAVPAAARRGVGRDDRRGRHVDGRAGRLLRDAGERHGEPAVGDDADRRLGYQPVRADARGRGRPGPLGPAEPVQRRPDRRLEPPQRRLQPRQGCRAGRDPVRGRRPGGRAGHRHVGLVPALLSNGEFVVREAIARRAMPFLQALNSGQAEALQATGARRYAQGGIVADTGSQLNAAVTRASVFAMQQDGKPYVWGAVGPDGYDCSGLMSAITNVLRGEAPHRRVGTAASAPWPGFVPGLSTAFAMGSSSGHTAGTLGGVNVESTGTHVRYGKDAHGADDTQFPVHSSLPLAGGTFVPGGGGGLDLSALIGRPVRRHVPDDRADRDAVRRELHGRQAGGVATAATDAVKGSALAKISALAAVSSVAGSPEVVAAVRAVAATFGWGSGPEWDALSSLISGESSWDPAIKNASTSATGLFQKMTSIHGPIEPTVAGQTQWGLNYIRSRYGDPINAYRSWLSRTPHWYHVGGSRPEAAATTSPRCCRAASGY
jgi:hypothetical protein